jgi:hypothetical protein
MHSLSKKLAPFEGGRTEFELRKERLGLSKKLAPFEGGHTEFELRKERLGLSKKSPHEGGSYLYRLKDKVLVWSNV